MPLQPGSRLGHFEIVWSLGAGGMGEVYRARDSRLDRQVAIKVLPEVVASEPNRLSRFEREAKALAALNHPNVATIHGIERDAQGEPSWSWSWSRVRPSRTGSGRGPCRGRRQPPSSSRSRAASKRRTSAASCIATSSPRT